MIAEKAGVYQDVAKNNVLFIIYLKSNQMYIKR